MSDAKVLKLLLVEDDLEDEQLLSEALLEIEENRLWPYWYSSRIVPVDHLADALDCLRADAFDAILLNLSLPDSPSLLDTFLQVRAAAPHTAIVVLADDPDEPLATRLLREGAQDVILKSELDCGPFAHAVHHALEREQRLEALESAAFLDELTGVLSHEAFRTAASCCLHMAQHGRVPLLLVSVDLTAPRDRREPVLMDVADALRLAFEPPSVIARWSADRLVVLAAGLSETIVDAMLQRVARRFPGMMQFSIEPIEVGDDLDEVASRTFSLRAKTAILAD